ncbi:MAG: TolC family outer membrane protein [Zoogloea sp.]|uniref:TolC family outer membrane protein n=1 Tax=Zoogloea sp. TaxID=49181 RepID=UPI0026113FD2|nr:TolC family outer membrane protein [Zoogloea sp.]MDD3328154.1 TolC family outer membrane protein [Zoogloea sp.]
MATLLTATLRRGLLACLAGCASVAWAAGPARLDLAEAWQAALEHDPTLRAAAAAADSGRELLPQAEAQLLPQVAFSYNRSANELSSTSPNLVGQRISSERNYMSSTALLSVRQPVIQPAQWAAVRQARAQGADAESQFANARQQLAARLAEAYFALLLAGDQIALVEAQRVAHSTQLDAARKALAGGSGTRTDIDEAQARLDMDVAQALEARQQAMLARRQLGQLVGVEFAEVAPLDLGRLAAQPPEVGELDDWLQLAEQNSAELRSLQARFEAATEEVAKARARHLPTLDAIAQYNRSDSETISRLDATSNTASIGVQLNVPIYSGGGVQSALRQAMAERTKAAENLAALRADLGLRLHREYRGLSEGLLRARALEQAVRSAEQMVSSSQRSFQAGARTTIDVLNAQQQLATARRDLSQARYIALLSQVRLQVLAGVFDEARLARLNDWLRH